MNRLFQILMVVFSLACVPHGARAALPGPLVETAWLEKNAGSVTILDVRADVKSFTSKPVFALDKKTGQKFLHTIGGHIPNAVLVDFKTVRGDRVIDGRKVTRMLPDKPAFEKLMQQWGVGRDADIVIVHPGEGDGDMTMATRLYWSIKYYGHDRVAILDGGMAQWLGEGRGISIDATAPKPGNWVASAERKEMLAGSGDVAKASADKSAQLVDTRSLGLYLGTWHKSSYVYGKGHIPGAKVFPNELLSSGEGPARFTGKEDLRALATTLGIKPDAPTITYCNSGHLASGSWFVMSELLGNKNVKLYDGSMHQWTLEKRPTTTLKMD